MNGSCNQKWKLDFNGITCLNVAGCVRRGRPRKSWSELVDEDMRLCGLSLRDAVDCKM